MEHIDGGCWSLTTDTCDPMSPLENCEQTLKWRALLSRCTSMAHLVVELRESAGELRAPGGPKGEEAEMPMYSSSVTPLNRKEGDAHGPRQPVIDTKAPRR